MQKEPITTFSNIRTFELTDVVKTKLFKTLQLYGNLALSYDTYNQLKEELAQFNYELKDSEDGYILTLKR